MMDTRAKERIIMTGLDRLARRMIRTSPSWKWDAYGSPAYCFAQRQFNETFAEFMRIAALRTDVSKLSDAATYRDGDNETGN